MHFSKKTSAVVFFVCALSAFGQKIYWVDGTNQRIHRANLDGSDAEIFVDTSSYPTALALDPRARKIYWTEWNADAVRRANLDGTNVETVIKNTTTPAGIAVDFLNGHVYWSEGSGTLVRIRRANLQGQSIQTILDTNNSVAEAIYLDLAAGKLYFILNFGTVNRCNLDGSQLETIIPESTKTSGIDLALDLNQNKLYWSAGWKELRLFRSSLEGSGPELLEFAQAHATSVAVDSCRRRAYWVESQDLAQGLRSIKSANVDGSDVVTLVSMPAIGDLLLDLPYQSEALQPPCIPAVSAQAALIFGFTLVIGGLIVMKRRHVPMIIFLASVSELRFAKATDLVANYESSSTVVSIDSGNVQASGGTSPIVIFSHELEVPDATWLRTHFKTALTL